MPEALSQEQVEEILVSIRAGMGAKAIAEAMGISRGSVYNVQRRHDRPNDPSPTAVVVDECIGLAAEQLVVELQKLALLAVEVFTKAMTPPYKMCPVAMRAAGQAMGWVVASADARVLGGQDVPRPLSFGDSPEPEHQPGGQQLRIVDGNGANGSNGNGRATA